MAYFHLLTPWDFSDIFSKASWAFFIASLAFLLILSLSHQFLGAAVSGATFSYLPADQNSALQYKQMAKNDGVSFKQHGHFLSGILMYLGFGGLKYIASLITTLYLTSSSSMSDLPLPFLKESSRRSAFRSLPSTWRIIPVRIRG